MLVEKNKEYIVDIEDNGFEGEGIAKIDNYTVFVQGAIKGEKIKIKTQLKARCAMGECVGYWGWGASGIAMQDVKDRLFSEKGVK